MKEESTLSVEKKSKFKVKMPHTFVLLFVLAIIAGLLTYVIPAGSYDRVEVNDRMLVDAATYHTVDPAPATLFQVLKAFPKGLEQAAAIVFFIFIVGGAFFVVQKSGAIDAGIAAAVRKTSGKGILIIPLLSIVFAFGGGIYGMAEECLPFIPALVILCISLGYDSMTGAAIALVATCAGFTGAFLNPFTIGVAQGIAELPLFSGLTYRIIVFAVMVLITITYIILYCLRIKKNPEKSLMYEIDRKRDLKVDLSNTEFTGTHKLILVVVLCTFGLLVFGVLKYGWYIQEISGLFFGMAIVVGIISRRGLNQLAEDFLEGCAMLAYGALVVGLARGILVIFTDSNVIDTIIYGMATAIQGLPTVITSLGIYISQIIISAIVPSGSGMAALTMPVLTPLADIVGVTRQTTVLAYQFADGFTNVLTPLSGYFMAGLALAGIPYQKWIKWILPLAMIWWIAGGIFVVIADAIHYGPF
ncbi:putative basic amino acid antiporter YfcC [Anoxybacterium hadale]|uniref:Basic amino acid antiporter YfcC n=1 Tax=Anoxybacterium hadale TaxID=3408580 RepID=A0ACD1AE29_9FIRM|nr:putative basic amino acid antiporter YfcC [Clostridiales bacterium]